MTRHRSRDNQASRSLLLEVRTNSLSTVEDTSQISINNLLPVINTGLENTSISCPSSVGNHDINLAEVADHVVDQLLDIGEVTDIALVGLALDTVVL